jgi:TonB family protein
VTIEPVSGSKIGRIVGHIPLLHRRRKDFTPARPIRQVAPSVPADEQLARDVPVDLRITVDPAGNVSDVEQTSRGASQELVRLASDAARSWQFVPARRDDETVSSELILHFKFPGSRPTQP